MAKREGPLASGLAKLPAIFRGGLPGAATPPGQPRRRRPPRLTEEERLRLRNAAAVYGVTGGLMGAYALLLLLHGTFLTGLLVMFPAAVLVAISYQYLKAGML